VDLGAPAARAALEDVGVVEQPVEERGDAAVSPRSLPSRRPAGSSEQRRGPFVAAHDQLEEISAAVCGSLRMPRSSTMSSATATRSSKYCLRVPSSEAIGQLFDRDMRLSIDDAVALLDCSAADGLGEMTLARARRTEQQHVFALTDKTRGCEIVDERAIHLLVEIEIKAVEGSVWRRGKRPA